MTNVQAILREIVNDLEKMGTGLAVLQARLHEVAPMRGLEIQDEMNVARQANRQFYDALREKIDALK